MKNGQGIDTCKRGLENMFDKIAEVSLLYDFYGQLLTKKQQNVMELYHEENYSLSEIATEFSISRQGVHDALKNAEKALYDYEKKLGLMQKFAASQAAIKHIDTRINQIIKDKKNNQNNDLIYKLQEIKDIIDKLEQ